MLLDPWFDLLKRSYFCNNAVLCYAFPFWIFIASFFFYINIATTPSFKQACIIIGHVATFASESKWKKKWQPVKNVMIYMIDIQKFQSWLRYQLSLWSMHVDLHGMFHREMCHICIAFKRAENDCELVHISRIITEQAKNICNFLTVSRPTPFSF